MATMSVRERAAGLRARFDSPSRMAAERDAGPGSERRGQGDRFNGARDLERLRGPLWQTRGDSSNVGRDVGPERRGQHSRFDGARALVGDNSRVGAHAYPVASARSSGGFSPAARAETVESPASVGSTGSARSPRSAARTASAGAQEAADLELVPESSQAAPKFLPLDGVTDRINSPSPKDFLDASGLAIRAQRLREEREKRRDGTTVGGDEVRLAALLEDADRKQVAELMEVVQSAGIDETMLTELIASEKFALGRKEHAKEDAAMLMKTYDTNGDGNLDKDEVDFLAELVEVEKTLEREEQVLDRQKAELVDSIDAAFNEELRRERERMAQQLQDRQNEHRERLRQAREELHALNGQLDTVKDQIAGPLKMPRRRAIGDGRSLTAAAQALDEEMTSSSSYTELKTPTSWGLSDDRSSLRPKTRIPRSVSRSKATLARAHEMQVQRSPRRGGSPRRSGSPQRTLSLPDGTGASPNSAHSATTGEGSDARRFKRPQSPLRSASSHAIAAAASPLLHEMLQVASPSIARFGSPGRYSQARSGSPRSGSRGRGRTRDKLDSPLASVQALSASRTNAHAFVQQLRSRSPSRDGYRSPMTSPARRALRLDDEGGDGAGASSPLAMKRPSSTGVSMPGSCVGLSCIQRRLTSAMLCSAWGQEYLRSLRSTSLSRSRSSSSPHRGSVSPARKGAR